MDFPITLPKDQPLVTITRPLPTAWVIEIHNGNDNRLTQPLLLEGISPALDIVERNWREVSRHAKKNGEADAGRGCLIIIGKRSQNKFFSNGFQYEDVLKKHWFIPGYFNPVLARLLSYPIPVVAAINGHAFAAGFLLALGCDYRVMTSGKAWGSMNEVHFGAPLPGAFVDVIKAKCSDPKVIRKICVEGHRFTPPELLEAGLVDEVVNGSTETVLEKALELGNRWSENAKAGVWGLIKRDMYREALEACRRNVRPILAQEEAELFLARL